MITDEVGRVHQALAYAAKGWKVYPIQPPKGNGCSCKKGNACKDPGKHPFFDLGGLKSATTEPDQLKTIFGRTEASIGLLCDSFWVLDCDGEQGLRDLDRLIDENGELPKTPTASTGGGGRHYLFKTDPRVAKNQTKLHGWSIDLKTKGGAIVAAPSLHVSGNHYRWIVSPEDCDLAAAPEWVIELVTNSTKKSVSSSEFTLRNFDLRTAPGAGEGERNDQLCCLVGSYLARLGATPDLLQLAMDWGRRCDPPMAVTAVAKTVGNLVAKHLANGSKVEAEALARASDPELGVRSFREIEPKPVSWLWPGRFALGKITLLTGEAGVGKSMLTCDMAARISKGSAFPDGAVSTLGDVFFIGCEDGAEDTVRPRLDAAGADVDRIHLISGPKPKGQEFALPIDLTRHMQQLHILLSKYPNAKLLVIDPIMDYLGDRTNSDKATDVRHVLSPLRMLAEHHGVCVVILNHLNKSGRSSKTRSLGSGAFVQVARIELRVCEDLEDATRRLLLPVKNNLAAATGLAYKIESAKNGQGYAVWEDGTVDTTIDEVESNGVGQVASSLTEAIDWLRSLLSDGPVTASEAFAKSKKDGISDITLKRAKKKLSVQVKQRDNKWWWMLPGQVLRDSNAPSAAENGDDTSSSTVEEEVEVGETSFKF